MDGDVRMAHLARQSHKEWGLALEQPVRERISELRHQGELGGGLQLLEHLLQQQCRRQRFRVGDLRVT